MTLQLISVLLQGFVAAMFGGSLIVGYRNLVIFRHQSQASVLKQAMQDYQALVADDAFEYYQGELESWRTAMLESSELQPTMAYYTKFTYISRIGFFYDHLGLLVRQGLLDFELCFEVVPMPYKFWNDTAEFRALMKNATYAEFWDPFEHLHNRYMAERARRARPDNLRALIERTVPVLGPQQQARHRPAGRVFRRR